MANPFTKAWKYLMALFSSKVDEYADPKVQIQQAIEDAQRQHAALSQQAAAVIGNQRQLEMKLTRQMGDVERLQASARQALVLADEARAKGDAAKAGEYEQTAQAFATQLVAAEQQMEDLKAMHDSALQAAQQAKKAVENNAMQLQSKLAERTKLLSQLEQAKMQEQVSASLQSMSQLSAPGNTPSLDEVRDKIERRYANALGASELHSSSVEGRMLEVQKSTLDMAGASRLDQLRAQLHPELGAQQARAIDAAAAGDAATATPAADRDPAGQPAGLMGKPGPLDKDAIRSIVARVGDPVRAVDRGADLVNQVSVTASEYLRNRRDAGVIAEKRRRAARRRLTLWAAVSVVTLALVLTEVTDVVRSEVTGGAIFALVILGALLIWGIVGSVRAARDLSRRSKVVRDLPPPQPKRPAVAAPIRDDMAKLDGYSDGLRHLVGLIGVAQDDAGLLAMRNDILAAADDAEARLRRQAVEFTGLVRARTTAPEAARAGIGSTADDLRRQIQSGVASYGDLVTAAGETVAATRALAAGAPAARADEQLAGHADQLRALAAGMRELTVD